MWFMGGCQEGKDEQMTKHVMLSCIRYQDANTCFIILASLEFAANAADYPANFNRKRINIGKYDHNPIMFIFKSCYIIPF